jgi:signal-transduction protein with cAMP-binding, CBS, and nucleotidyltransferase domain
MAGATSERKDPEMSDVEEVMSAPPVTCTPETSVERAARMMAEHEVGFLPVVDVGGELVGVVTDRDLVVRAMAQSKASDLHVAHVMTHDPACTVVGRSLLEAARQMAMRECRRLPVVGQTGAVVGVLSLDDVLRRTGAEADTLARLVAAEGHRRVLVLP